MRRALLSSMVLFSLGCLTPTESTEIDDDHPLDITLGRDEIKTTFTLIDGYYESPVMEVPAGASRVAAMLTLTDVPVDIARKLQARLVRDDGSTSDWVPMDVTFNEEELRVIRTDLAEVGSQVQLRVPEGDVDFIRLLTWSAVIPQDEELADDSAISVANSEQGQALNGDLANAGVLARSAWNARPTRCTSSDRPKERMAIHHTAGAPTAGGSYEAGLRQIQAYHMDGRGYCDAGYHFAVTLDGRVWELRPLNFLGGHSRSYNSGNAGIVLVGCFDSSGACANVSGPRTPPDAMVQGAARVVAALSNMYGIAINSDRIKGHGQQPYQQTGCPGDGGRARLEDIRAAARNGTAPAPSDPPPPAGDECGQVRVNTSGGTLNIRPTASTANSPVGTLADGARVERISSTEGQSVNGNRTWHRIRRNDGVVGYVSAAYTQCIATPAAQPATATPVDSPTGCAFMGANEALTAGQAVNSCDGRFTFVHQADGNVVLYKAGVARWASNTNGRSTGTLIMQADGNLVLYSPGGTAVWSSQTHGNPGATLAVQDDGNVVIYAPGNRAIWATGTDE
ncbi:MAG: N-acetylmuramoyl-L-alanine amidase [Myxococcota bacterium]